MEIVTTMFALCVTVIVIYLGSAFFTATIRLDNVESDTSAVLERLINDVKEIEFDYSAGKLSKEDFTALRKRYVAKIAREQKTGN